MIPFYITLFATLAACVGVAAFIVVRKQIRETRWLEYRNTEIKKSFSKLKQSGIKATIKHRIGSLLIGIDENNDRWYIIDSDDPSGYILQSISSVVGTKIIKEKQRQGTTARVRVSKGISIGGYQANDYYVKCGVLVKLKDLRFPTVYVDCLSYPSTVERVAGVFDAMKKYKQTIVTGTPTRLSASKNTPDNSVVLQEPRPNISQSLARAAETENTEKTRHDYYSLIMSQALSMGEIKLGKAKSITHLGESGTSDLLLEMVDRKLLKINRGKAAFQPRITSQEWFDYHYRHHEADMFENVESNP